jgi:hypothetical protein
MPPTLDGWEMPSLPSSIFRENPFKKCINNASSTPCAHNMNDLEINSMHKFSAKVLKRTSKRWKVVRCTLWQRSTYGIHNGVNYKVRESIITFNAKEGQVRATSDFPPARSTSSRIVLSTSTFPSLITSTELSREQFRNIRSASHISRQ